MEQMLVASTAGSSTQTGTYVRIWALQGNQSIRTESSSPGPH